MKTKGIWASDVNPTILDYKVIGLYLHVKTKTKDWHVATEEEKEKIKRVWGVVCL